MRANFYATFRLLIGEKSIEIDLPEGATIVQALDEIVRVRPALRSHWMNEDGELYPHVHVFINGQEVMTLPDQLSTRLEPDDTLDFFPPVAGGTFQ